VSANQEKEARNGIHVGGDILKRAVACFCCALFQLLTMAKLSIKFLKANV